MLTIDARIGRAQRLLRMLEEDVPMLAARVADLTPEYQNSAKNFAERLAAQTRAELDRLQIQRDVVEELVPEPAD
jgi:hypothetical protein